MSTSHDHLIAGALPGYSEAVVVTDALGAVRYCDSRAADYFGADAANFIGQAVSSLLPGLALKSTTMGYNFAFLNFWFTPGKARPMQALSRDGHAFSLLVTFSALEINDRRYAVLGLSRPEVDAAAAERLREEQASAEQSEEAIIITDLDGVICYVNPAFEALTGYSREEAVGQTPAFLRSGVHSAQFYDRLWTKLHAGNEFRGVFVNRKRNGEIYHQATSILPLWDAHGTINHYISTGCEIYAPKGLELDAALQPGCDPLTRLPDRALFMDLLNQAIAYEARRKHGLAMAYIDVGGLSEINGIHGDSVGDAVLRVVALRLAQCVRDEDTVARIGGDRFAILCMGITRRTEASRVLDKVTHALHSAIWVGELRIPLSAYVGACMFPDDGASAPVLLALAATALDKARATGCTSYSWFSGADQESSVST